MSGLGAESGGLVESLGGVGIRFLWHPAFSEETGAEALAILDDVAEGRVALDALCVEGAALTGPNASGRFQILSGSGRPMVEWLRRIAVRARYVVAVGSCAAYGGFAAAADLGREATGLAFSAEEPGGLLGEGFVSGGGLGVVNIAGCAPHPGWVVETLMALATGGLGPGDLDGVGRPRFFADHLAHHGCARNEYYEYKASAAEPSQLGCLMENLGCKATQAPGDCNLRQWNGGGACPNAGFACINCTSPGFENSPAPFGETAKIAGIPVGLPTDMPKAWFVALSALSKSATPARVKRNAHADHVVAPPVPRRPVKP